MSEKAARIFEFIPGGQAVEMSDDPSVRPPSWFARRFYDLGVLDMAPSTNRPSGFYVNWTTITSIVLIVSAIVGLWYFTWQSAQQIGFEKGKAEAERMQLLERLGKTEDELRRTKDLRLVQSGQQAGHEQEKK